MSAWLRPLTPLYSVVVRCRREAYRRRLLPSVRLGAPVVSVGNLTFGGTGKTPTVIALARDLVRHGRRPAVLTRGWGRATDAPMVAVAPDERLHPEVCGDEPLEIAFRLPGVPVVVDGDRVRGGAEAIRRGADVLLLDDGFQHLRVARDVDLLLVDAGDPWGGGRLPPAGRLREPADGLRRADLVVVTKLAPDDGDRLAELVDEIHRLAPRMPVLGARLAPTRVRTEAGWRPVSELRGRRVVAFAGLGRPEGFLDSLRQAGAEPAACRWFPDHHDYAGGELSVVLAEADRLGAVAVTTRKDAVKLSPAAPVWVLEVEMVPVGGSWDPVWELLAERRP